MLYNLSEIVTLIGPHIKHQPPSNARSTSKSFDGQTRIDLINAMGLNNTSPLQFSNAVTINGDYFKSPVIVQTAQNPDIYQISDFKIHSRSGVKNNSYVLIGFFYQAPYRGIITDLNMDLPLNAIYPIIMSEESYNHKNNKIKPIIENRDWDAYKTNIISCLQAKIRFINYVVYSAVWITKTIYPNEWTFV